MLVLWETVLVLGGAGVLAPLGLAFGSERSVALGSALCVLALVAFLPVLRLAARWVPALREGVNTYHGYVTHHGVAESQGRQWKELAEV